MSEKPAIDLLAHFGYAYMPAKDLESERINDKSWVLKGRLIDAIKKLNPWINSDNARFAANQIAGSLLEKQSLLEANEHFHDVIVKGTEVEQEIDGYKRNRRVHLVDWTNPLNNDLLVVNQTRSKGHSGYTAKPDLVLLVNGIPFIIIECKSPTKTAPLIEALNDLQTYQNFAPILFEPGVAIVGAAGIAGAKYGMVEANQQYYKAWKDPYPLTLKELEDITGRTYNLQPPADDDDAGPVYHQDFLVAGLLRPENLLDIMRNYVVFDKEEGVTIKKMARYHQFRAVDKIIKRITTNTDAKKRGGTVFHTQGSGKSLTMVFLAGKLRSEHVGLENPLIVIVTDRTDLDAQIGKKFKYAGYADTVTKARSKNHLRELLQLESGTITTTVQKFQDVLEDVNEALNDGREVHVLVDEAHRTQYGLLAMDMRTALPNAVYYGFTGTPLDEDARNTTGEFGSYFDIYNRRDSELDGNTLKVTYDPRLVKLNIEGEDIQALFNEAFKDKTEEERKAIVQKYGTMKAVAASPSRIRKICMDIRDHYRTHIEPNGFKAMVVASSKEAAHIYNETLQELGAPESALILSEWNKADDDSLKEHIASQSDQKALIERFKKEDDPLKILVVCNKLLTGFDAPILQVLYVDRSLKDHSLLQALDRTNRPRTNKYKGLVVDYWGFTKNLKEALSAFQPKDVQNVWQPTQSEKDVLKVAHDKVMAFFQNVNREDKEACVLVLAPEDTRFKFNEAYLRFMQILDFMLPNPAAAPYKDNAKWLMSIRKIARNLYVDNRLNLEGAQPKVKKLIEEHVRGEGVLPMTKPIDVTTPEGRQRVEEFEYDESRALAMKHALSREISIRLGENPGAYDDLAEKLKAIIRDHEEGRKTALELYHEYMAILDQLMDEPRLAQQLGLTETEFAFYQLLEATGEFDGESVVAAKDLVAAIKDHTHIVDWQDKEKPQREMRVKVKVALKEHGMEWTKTHALAAAVVQQARREMS